MPTKIFIGNLSSNTRSEDVRTLFEKYGKVTECDVLKNFGFVHMQNESDAESAIKDLDGYSIKGSRMRVEMSTGKSKGGRFGGGGKMRGGGRGGRGGGDRYGGYDPYRRPPPPYDYYERRYSPREDRRPPPPGDDRYPPPRDPRDRYYGYERRPPPPDHYERSHYDRPRTTASDPYYRDRSVLNRPPPDYYRRYPDVPYPDAAGDRPSPSMYDDGYSNGYHGYYERDIRDEQSLGSGSYYDRYYKKSSQEPMPPPSGKTHVQDEQAFLQSEPLYF